jgi:hypothetical protein
MQHFNLEINLQKATTAVHLSLSYSGKLPHKYMSQPLPGVMTRNDGKPGMVTGMELNESWGISLISIVPSKCRLNQPKLRHLSFSLNFEPILAQKRMCTSLSL